MPKHPTAALVLAASLPMAIGCQGPEASGRPPEWSFSGANNSNLAAMIDDPMDLVHGRGDRRASGQLAAAAVTRLRRDQVKPLPSIETSQTRAAGGGAAPAGAAAGGAEPQ